MKKYLFGVALAAALATPALAADMHQIFFELGVQMQSNLDCHNGGPIHLDDYPLDPGVYEFRAAYPALAHKWAMEGVYFAQSHPHRC
jgi:hypothetical protein